MNETLQQFRQELTDWPMYIFMSSLAIGFLTMTIIDLLKTGVRQNFNYRAINLWLYGFWRDPINTYSHDLNKLSETLKKTKYKDKIDDLMPAFQFHEEHRFRALEELMLLSTAGNKEAFLSLPLENLCGQLSIAVNSMLDTPRDYRTLLYHLLRESKFKAVVLESYITLVTYEEGKTVALQEAAPDQAAIDFVAARNIVGPQLQRNIDAFQINTNYAWRKKIRVASLTAAFGLAILGNLLFAVSGSWAVISFLIVAEGYAAAFLSSFIRDLFAVVESYKK